MVHAEMPALGYAADHAGRDGDYADFMAARQRSLLRTAYLLTGDRRAAEELVHETLAKLYLSWGRVARDGADEQARRLMFTAYLSPWHRLSRGRRQLPSEVEPESGGTSALWARIESLPPRQRAVVVLCHYEGLDEAAAAEVLGIRPGKLGFLAARARARVMGDGAT